MQSLGFTDQVQLEEIAMIPKVGTVALFKTVVAQSFPSSYPITTDTFSETQWNVKRLTIVIWLSVDIVSSKFSVLSHLEQTG
jgi:hypothetical protein